MSFDSSHDLIYSIALGIAFLVYAGFRIYQLFMLPSKKMEVLFGKERVLMAKPWALVTRMVLYLIGFGFLIASFYLPMGEEKPSEDTNQGVDILFMVDVSLSMNAVDASPTRLGRFKELLLPLLPELHGNRLGILVFAGSPFLYCPLTTDIYTFADFLRGLDVDIVGDKGSEIGSAFDKAGKILNTEKVLRNRILVIVSDGEDHSDSEIPELSAKVVVWGLGDKYGSPIFYHDPDTKTQGYVTHQGTIVPNSGFPEVVQSIGNQEWLREIARLNQGEYYDLTKNGAGVYKLMETIEGMGKNSNRILNDISRNQNSHLLLIPAVILLLIDVLLLDFFMIPGRKL